MIVCSNESFTIGAVVRDGTMSDGNREWHTATFYVLGPATREEYEAYAFETTGLTDLEPKPYYYRVSMD